MPISLKELNALKAEVEVELYPGITTKVTYRLDAFGDGVLKEIDAATSGRGLGSVLAHGAPALEKLLVTWEITDDKGKPLAITQENIKRLGVRVVDRLLGAILGDRDPNLIKSASYAHLEAE